MTIRKVQETGGVMVRRGDPLGGRAKPSILKEKRKNFL